MPVTLQNISDAAITETGRSDKTALADRMAAHGVMLAHSLDYFPQDRQEDNNVLPSSAAATMTKALPTRFRKFSLIEPLQSTGIRYAVGAKRVFVEKDPSAIFSFEGELIKEYYYIQGSNVFLESVDTINRLRWLWYQYPDLSSMSNYTWLTEKYKNELIDFVCYHIYRREGDEKRASGYLEAWKGNPRVGIIGHMQRIINENLLAEL